MLQDRRRQIVMAALVTAALAGPAAAQTRPASVECMVRCAQGTPGGVCRVRESGGSGAPEVKNLTLKEPRLIRHCPEAMLVEQGVLEALVRSAGGVKRFLVKEPNKSFRSVAAPLFATASCLGADPACLESRDQMRVAGVGGKGIGTLVQRRIGEPCSLGLPCGSILRPSSTVVLSLTGAPPDGELRASQRAEGAAVRRWRIEGGRLSLEPDFFQNGMEYVYELVDGAQTVVAAGGFSVVSGKMQLEVQDELGKLGGQRSRWDVLEILLDNNLLWDAQRVSD
jgi:hypothetical protein